MQTVVSDRAALSEGTVQAARNQMNDDFNRLRGARLFTNMAAPDGAVACSVLLIREHVGVTRQQDCQL
jgi:hypothetical protein